MGFNPDASESTNTLGKGKGRAVDDGEIGRDGGKTTGLGIGRRPEGGLKRAVTLGSEFFQPENLSSAVSASENLISTTTTAPETSAADPTSIVPRRTGGQGTLAAWMSGNTTTQMGSRGDSQPASRIFIAGRKSVGNRLGASAFASGLGRGGRKVSRNPGLPSVVASPVKGSSHDIVEGPEDEAHSRGPDFLMECDQVMETNRNGSMFDGKEAGAKDSRPGTWLKDAFRRASLASQALSQSLVEVQTEAVKSSMGPPPVPPGKAETSSTEGSSTANRSLRFSTRISAAVANAKIASGFSKDPNQSAGADASSSKNDDPKSKDTRKPVTLDVLKNCTVFVDVRTDDGDDAGGLFVQMLRDMGARVSLFVILRRAICDIRKHSDLDTSGPNLHTYRVQERLSQYPHTLSVRSSFYFWIDLIIDECGLYSLLNDPKPKVVGIAWVVECVEQRQRVDEQKFNVDLDDMSITGVNKVCFDPNTVVALNLQRFQATPLDAPKARVFIRKGRDELVKWGSGRDGNNLW